MAYNFSVDSVINEDIVSNLDATKAELESIIDEIYSEIASLESCWQGDSYNVFQAKCLEYRPALDALVLQIAAFSRLHSTRVEASIDDLKSEVEAAFSEFGG